MTVEDSIDEFFLNMLMGSRKKYLILALSIIAGLILVIPFVNPLTAIYNLENNNPVGIESVQFNADNIPGGLSQDIVGHLYRSRDAMETVLDPLNPESAESPGIVMLHGWVNGLGKETMIKWAVELARRDFVVLSIDLPGQGHTTGDAPSFLPRSDFEPYVIKGAIDYLKDLPYVNSSSIGLCGWSYGGTAAAMTSGIFPDQFNATVVMSGFLNLTDWLISDGGILDTMNMDFSVNEQSIDLSSINGRAIQEADIDELLRAYRMVREDSNLAEAVIVPGTTKINRTELDKMDAVNYLGGAEQDSIMFIHPQQDPTFAYTNQSGQGYDAAVNGAVYYPVTCGHNLLDCVDANWGLINFFKDKMTNNTLTEQPSTFEYYSQESDGLGFTTQNLITGSEIIWRTIGIICLAIIPVSFIISIIYYSKQIETARASEEYTEEDKELRFTGGNYWKTMTGLAMEVLFAALLLWLCTNGRETGTVMITLTTMFYISFYFTMIYVPDEAEIKKKRGIPEDKPIRTGAYFKKRDKKDKIRTLLIAVGVIISVSLLLGLAMPSKSIFGNPVDSLSLLFLTAGIILSVSAILFIRQQIKNNDELLWSEFELDRYSVIKSISCGATSGLNVLVIYNVIAFALRFPFNIGARGPYYIYVLGSVIALAFGLHLWIEVIIRKTIYTGESLKAKIAGWLISTGIGASLSFLSGWLLLVRMLNFEPWLSGNIPIFGALAFMAAYLIGRLIELISSETGVLTTTTYIPIVLVTVVGYFIRI